MIKNTYKVADTGAEQYGNELLLQRFTELSTVYPVEVEGKTVNVSLLDANLTITAPSKWNSRTVHAVIIVFDLLKAKSLEFVYKHVENIRCNDPDVKLSYVGLCSEQWYECEDEDHINCGHVEYDLINILLNVYPGKFYAENLKSVAGIRNIAESITEWLVAEYEDSESESADEPEDEDKDA
jgi:hypothetical protein